MLRKFSEDIPIYSCGGLTDKVIKYNCLDTLTFAEIQFSDVGVHLEENIQEKKTTETVSHLGSVDEKCNHRIYAIKDASVQLK